MSSLIVGLMFAIIIGFSGYKSWQSVRENKCPGCSGSCSTQKKKDCSALKNIDFSKIDFT
jgi:hypothetical protein